MPAPSHFIDVDGTRLECVDGGAGDAVLVIHGAGSDGRIWAEDLEPLARSHRLVTYSRRGYGGSGPGAADWRVHSADAAALIIVLGLGPATVVAHSAGSIVALDLVARRPHLVRQLVLLDPAFGARRPSFRLVRAFLAVRLLSLSGSPRRAIDGWMRFVTGYPTGGSAFERMGVQRREAIRANADGIFADLASGDGSALVSDAQLADIRIPVTVITGRLSPAFLTRASQALLLRMPGARARILEGAGHALAFDQPGALIDELTGALDRLDLRELGRGRR